MNIKKVKNIKLYRQLFRLTKTRKAFHIIMLNQVLIFTSPIIVSAHSLIGDTNISSEKEIITNPSKVISESLSNSALEILAEKEKDNYVNNVAEFYGVEDNVIEDVIVDITEKEPEKITSSSNPEAIIIEESQNKINRENIQVEQNAFFTFAASSPNKINEIKNSEIGTIYEKYGKMYGIDPDLLMARDMQESGLEHNSFNPNGAYGISQIEHTLFNSPVHVFNYETNSYDDFTITEEGALEIDTNIKYGAAKMQERLRSYNNNIFLALQAYNYGSGSLDKVINKYSKVSGKNYDEIINDKDNFGLLKYYIDDFHYNPSLYIDWSYGTYGDKDYIPHIMRYISDEVITIKDEHGNDIIFNLKTSKSINLADSKLDKYVEDVKFEDKKYK